MTQHDKNNIKFFMVGIDAIVGVNTSVGVTMRILGVSLMLVVGGFFVWGQEDAQVATITIQDQAIDINDVLGNNSTEDERVNDYLAARKLLVASVTSLGDDASEARRQLESAQHLFESLQSGNVGGDSLIKGVGTTFQHAEMAIANRSVEDLLIQKSVIEGGLQRLLYESALQSINEGDFETAKNRVTYIADDIGLSEEQRAAIASATNQVELSKQLEFGVVDNVNAYSQKVRDLTAGGNTNLAEAYLNLASAYSNYILVQDSPHIPQGTGQTFNKAFRNLLQAKSDMLEEDLNTLGNQMEAFRTQTTTGTPLNDATSGIFINDQVVSDQASLPAPAVPTSIVVSPDETNNINADAVTDQASVAMGIPSVVGAPSVLGVGVESGNVVASNTAFGNGTEMGDVADADLQQGIVGNSGVPVVPVSAIANPLTDTNVSASAVAETTLVLPDVSNPDISDAAVRTNNIASEGVGAATISAPIVSTPASVSELVSTPGTEASQISASNRTLQAHRISARNSLNKYALPAGSIDSLVEAYAENSFDDVDAVFQMLYSDAAQTAVAVEVGNQAGAKQHINSFKEHYDNYLKPIITQNDLPTHTMTSDLLKSLEASPALRLQDTALLLGQVNTLKEAANNQPSSVTHDFLVKLGTFWVGWPRVIAMILAALASIVPLYLLNRAFGVNNPNWRWVGVALFLLLAPVIFEGMTFLSATIEQQAQRFNIGYHDVLSPYSIFQNSLSQVIWLVLTLLAIIFASVGLYGICVQFGVFGGRGTTNRATVISQNDTQVTTGDVGADTVVDWDDEDF